MCDLFDKYCMKKQNLPVKDSKFKGPLSQVFTIILEYIKSNLRIFKVRVTFLAILDFMLEDTKRSKSKDSQESNSDFLNKISHSKVS